MTRLRGRPLRSPQLLAAAVILPTLAGCYPGETPLSDVTVTLYDTGKNFKASYTTFTLPDTLVDIGDPDAPGSTPILHKFDQDILRRVRDNLIARGWTEIPGDQLSPTNRPDVVVLVSALVSQDTAISGYPPYWGWWPGWGYSPPNWGYPPCCVTVVQYTTGTLLLDMLAEKDADMGTETIPVPWAARMNGLVNSSNVTVSRLNQVIDQAFTQSPYLDIK